MQPQYGQPPADPAYAAWLASQGQPQPAPQYAPPPPPQQPVYAPPNGQGYQGGYAQPAPAAPQYQQQYAQAGQLTPQPAAPAQSAGFSAPPPPVTRAAVSPRPRDMDGRLVLVAPTAIEYGVVSQSFKDAKTGEPIRQDRLTVDLYVLDGGPMHMGGSPENGTPHTHIGGAPAEYLGKFLSGAVIVQQLTPYLPQNNPAAKYSLGRLVRKPNPNAKPGQPLSWMIADPSEADMAIAAEFLAKKAMGTLQLIEPQPLNAPQPPQPGPMAQAQAQYQPAPQPQQPAADPGYAAWLASQGQPQPAPQYAPPPPPQQPVYAPAAPAAPMAPQMDLNTPPANFDPNMWAGLDMATRAQILGSAATPAPWR